MTDQKASDGYLPTDNATEVTIATVGGAVYTGQSVYSNENFIIITFEDCGSRHTHIIFRDHIESISYSTYLD